MKAVLPPPPPGREIPLDEIRSGIICSRALAAHRPFSLLSGLGHYISHLLRSSSVPLVAAGPRKGRSRRSRTHPCRPLPLHARADAVGETQAHARCAVGGTMMIGWCAG